MISVLVRVAGRRGGGEEEDNGAEREEHDRRWKSDLVRKAVVGSLLGVLKMRIRDRLQEKRESQFVIDLRKMDKARRVLCGERARRHEERAHLLVG